MQVFKDLSGFCCRNVIMWYISSPWAKARVFLHFTEKRMLRLAYSSIHHILNVMFFHHSGEGLPKRHSSLTFLLAITSFSVGIWKTNFLFGESVTPVSGLLTAGGYMASLLFLKATP